MPGTILKWFYFIALIVEGIIRYPHHRRNKSNKLIDDRFNLIDMLLLFIFSLGLFYLPLIYCLTDWFNFANYKLPLYCEIAGMVICIMALWLFWRSHEDLGLNWSFTLRIRENHGLVTDGVYRYIRHPMYASQWLWGIAQVLLLQNLIAGPATLLLFLPLYIFRVSREEKMMLDTFGDEFLCYKSKTGRIIPDLR